MEIVYNVLVGFRGEEFGVSQQGRAGKGAGRYLAVDSRSSKWVVGWAGSFDMLTWLVCRWG